MLLWKDGLLQSTKLPPRNETGDFDPGMAQWMHYGPLVYERRMKWWPSLCHHMRKTDVIDCAYGLHAKRIAMAHYRRIDGSFTVISSPCRMGLAIYQQAVLLKIR